MTYAWIVLGVLALTWWVWFQIQPPTPRHEFAGHVWENN